MKIAVVIPCYKEKCHVAAVIAGIGPEVSEIIVVDDACPDGSGKFVESEISDPRITVLFRESNGGVGAAVCTGYEYGLSRGADILVKVDGDGQMDPADISRMVRPIIEGNADYVKGNRFHSFTSLSQMPKHRIIGNFALTLMTKLSSGYWNIADPTNGFTAIHKRALSRCDLSAVSKDYFFESDMLFHLYLARGKVLDVPMDAAYGDETSGLVARRWVFPFLFRNVRNLVHRLVFTYLYRDITVHAVYLLISIMLLAFGFAFGISRWLVSSVEQSAATPGTVMLAALPIIIAIQLGIAFLQRDLENVPRIPISCDGNVK